MEITSLLTFLEGMGINNPCKYLTCRDLLLLGARTDSDFFTKISRNFKTFQITEYQ